MQQTGHKYLPISDYGIIGDLQTVALVGKNSSIDWLCLPHIDSPSVFGALLDTEKGGFFRFYVSNSEGGAVQQTYYPNTNVLLTRYSTSEGYAELTDFMPVKESDTPDLEHALIRSVTVIHGSLEGTLVCRPAFNYGRDPHKVRLTSGGAIFESQNFTLALSSPFALEEDDAGGVTATVRLYQGDTAHFILQSTPNPTIFPPRLSNERYQDIFHKTLSYWYAWVSQCKYQGRWREMVQRSALVLKLLTFAPTGAIVAAATTSLPEGIGGTRNWDYRYTWLRDSAFTLNSMLSLGFTQEAQAFMDWLNDRCHEQKASGMLQPLYGIRGEQTLTEYTLEHFEGYKGSRPVRVGNGAYSQKQLDTYGEVLDAIFIYNKYDAISYDLWRHIEKMLAWLAEHWREQDEGIWEVRGGQRHFVHSRLMCWVAFDRAIRIAQDRGWPAPLSEWENIRTEIYKEVITRGWNPEKQSFVQYYGGDVVDASTLLILLTRFVGPREPRMLATIKRIQEDLGQGASVLRYDPVRAADDGLAGSYEGAFSACSFWLVESLARTGKLFEARIRLEKLLSLSNHVGLFAEEIDIQGNALGNFPQAFTHLALISACIALNEGLDSFDGRTNRYAILENFNLEY